MRILSYTVGLTHLYNQGILKRCLPEFSFTALLGNQLAHLLELDAVRALDIEIVLHDNQSLDDSIWHPRPSALFFANAYPSDFRCRLVRKAVELDIPVLSIQEVNQLANTDSVGNHYFLPLDQLGVASQIEAERFQEIGYAPEQTVLTGWPFYSANKAGRAELPNEQRILRADLGLGNDEKIALLALSSLKEKAIETFETLRLRQAIFELIAAGLPSDMRLVIKPHPAEDRKIVQANADAWLPGAIVMDGKVPIEQALAISDLVVNHGNSQVVFEAMLHDKPLVVVPLGIRSLFDRAEPDLVARTPERFAELCDQVIARTPDYAEILARHVPLSPSESLECSARLFRAAAHNSPLVGKWSKRLDLSLQMQLAHMDGEAERELQALTGDEGLPTEYSSVPDLLYALFAGRAELGQIERLLDLFADHSIRLWHIQALWIRQLYRSRRDREFVGSGLVYVQSFNGRVNPHYFIRELMMRMDLEYLTGDEGVADQLRAWFQRDYYFLPIYQWRELRLRLLRDRSLDFEGVKLAVSFGVWGCKRVFGALKVRMGLG